ncbi:MAG: patatin-like phospholipase family protein [Pseudolabrys sp.]
MSDVVTERAPSEAPKPTATEFESVALLLQGGGALGSYQAGVYEALIEHDIEPTWIAGISIGSVNSAIIAGNPPAERVAKLRTFWEGITAAGTLWSNWTDMFTGLGAREYFNQISAGQALTSGVAGFFKPRFPPPPMRPNGTPEATSWYDNGELKRRWKGWWISIASTHARCVSASARLTYAPANFAYFDNAKDTIRSDHIMASCALPPAFPAVKIGDECLLGWRHGFQHAARLGSVGAVGLGYAGVSGGPVERARRAAARSFRSRGADEGDPVFEPHPRRHRSIPPRSKTARGFQ